MATKDVKRKKKAAPPLPLHHEEAPEYISLSELQKSPVPWLKMAIVCLVDDPKSFVLRTGLTASAMPRFAKVAAKLCSGHLCFFCAKKQELAPKATLLDFQPEYALCPCFLPLRKMAYEYIPGWDTPEGKNLLLSKDASGELDRDEPVHQFVCNCGEGPIKVSVGRIVHGYRTFNRALRVTRCNKCQEKQKKRWVAQQQQEYQSRMKTPVAAIIAVPKESPAGKFNPRRKNKKAKDQLLPGERPLAAIPVEFPPLAALEVAPEAAPT